MGKVDWSKAPSDAEACIYNAFTKWVGNQEYEWDSTKMEWEEAMPSWSLDSYNDNVGFSVVMRPDNWKEGEKRMEPIVQNGNDGEHYADISRQQESRRLELEKAEKEEQAKVAAIEVRRNKLKYHREIKRVCRLMCMMY